MLPTIFRRKGDLTNWLDDYDPFFSGLINDEKGVVTNFPRVDVHEDENNFYIEADMPGIEKEDVKIRAENNVLTLSGERDSKHEEKKKGYYRLERQTGSFERSFHLGEQVDLSKAQADFEKGVLKITVPKKEELKPKEINIDIK